MVPGLVPGSHPLPLTSCHWDHHHKTDLLQPGASWHPTLSLSLSLSLSWRKLVPQSGQLGPPLCEEISQILGGTEGKQLSSGQYRTLLLLLSSQISFDQNLLSAPQSAPISTTGICTDWHRLDQMYGGNQRRDRQGRDREGQVTRGQNLQTIHAEMDQGYHFITSTSSIDQEIKEELPSSFD